jgi:hypothetical protein
VAVARPTLNRLADAVGGERRGDALKRNACCAGLNGCADTVVRGVSFGSLIALPKRAGREREAKSTALKMARGAGAAGQRTASPKAAGFTLPSYRVAQDHARGAAKEARWAHVAHHPKAIVNLGDVGRERPDFGGAHARCANGESLLRDLWLPFPAASTGKGDGCANEPDVAIESARVLKRRAVRTREGVGEGPQRGIAGPALHWRACGQLLDGPCTVAAAQCIAGYLGAVASTALQAAAGAKHRRKRAAPRAHG